MGNTITVNSLFLFNRDDISDEDISNFPYISVVAVTDRGYYIHPKNFPDNSIGNKDALAFMRKISSSPALNLEYWEEFIIF